MAFIVAGPTLCLMKDSLMIFIALIYPLILVNRQTNQARGPHTQYGIQNIRTLAGYFSQISSTRLELKFIVRLWPCILYPALHQI